jgi:hypothetical protein
MAGVNLRSVQELMGHKSIEMAVRYSHLLRSRVSPQSNGSRPLNQRIQLALQLAPARPSKVKRKRVCPVPLSR